MENEDDSGPSQIMENKDDFSKIKNEDDISKIQLENEDDVCWNIQWFTEKVENEDDIYKNYIGPQKTGKRRRRHL